VQEVQALAAVEGHPNIVTLHDSWTEPAEHNQGGLEASCLTIYAWQFCAVACCVEGHSVAKVLTAATGPAEWNQGECASTLTLVTWMGLLFQNV
jgi:hypothetical protein